MAQYQYIALHLASSETFDKEGPHRHQYVSTATNIDKDRMKATDTLNIFFFGLEVMRLCACS